jgi:nitrate/TMAO reductase-like tetraheme cytochrome c subunit
VVALRFLFLSVLLSRAHSASAVIVTVVTVVSVVLFLLVFSVVVVLGNLSTFCATRREGVLDVELR